MYFCLPVSLTSNVAFPLQPNSSSSSGFSMSMFSLRVNVPVAVAFPGSLSLISNEFFSRKASLRAVVKLNVNSSCALSVDMTLPRLNVHLYVFPAFNAPYSGMNSTLWELFHLAVPLTEGENLNRSAAALLISASFPCSPSAGAASSMTMLLSLETMPPV